ncbi:hypothetical protein Mapa_015319 [Marchantia paleacea]|nr:hypothetical protein Mapa_015319 [Marchantia paleacea]
MHGVNNVQGVVEKGKPLSHRHVHGNDSPQCDKIVERSVQIQGGGDDGDPSFFHSHCEGARPSSQIQPNSNGPIFELQNIVDREVQIASRGDPPGLLPRFQIEAIKAVCKLLLLDSSSQAVEALASVGRPDDSAIAGSLPQRVRKRIGFCVVVGSAREAPPSRQRLAASDQKLLSQGLIVGALVPHFVLHVLVQLRLHLCAAMAHGRDYGVPQKSAAPSQWKLPGLHIFLELSVLLAKGPLQKRVVDGVSAILCSSSSVGARDGPGHELVPNCLSAVQNEPLGALVQALELGP